MRPFYAGSTIMDRIFSRATLAMVAATLLALSAVGAQAEPSKKWRIKLNHRVDNDATVVFRVSPVGGTPIDVETKIPAGTGENKAAKMIRDSFRVSLGEGYHVETDDGEDVVIKKRKDTPEFELALQSSNAAGLTIELKN